MKTILLTGGTGFIGSHTCLELLEKNYQVILLDSLVNSSIKTLKRIEKISYLKGINYSGLLSFYQGDMKDESCLENIFEQAFLKGNPIEAVIHFAGLKSVSQSVKFPLEYWGNNLIGSINLLKVMNNNNCRNLIFSSSASIYGRNKKGLLNEKDKINPINPYSNTKFAIEILLNDLLESYPNSWKILNLRYFNPIGAHDSGMIGEEPKGMPNNIFPIILEVASKNISSLKIFGKDWPTKDGTGVRDYVHIMDIATGHASALEYLFSSEYEIVNLNLGTGKGTSVLDLIKSFEKENQVKIPYEFIDKREGDLPIVIADNKLVLDTLNWKPSRSIEQMCRDGWNWKKNLELNHNNF